MFREIPGLVALVVIGMSVAHTGAGAADPPARPRVGVYDARAVAVAFVASPMQASELKEKMAQLGDAKAKGDAKAVAELEAWGKFTQARRHLQGFAGAPVDDILARVADRLPAIAKTAGVDVIVRKGDYVSDRCEQVDVTDELVKLFEPTDRTWKTVREIRGKPPLDPKVIEEAERRGKF
jgi:hypothetical protein